MNTPTNFHLTDDQIDEFLIGDLSEEAVSHLAACDPCQVRVTAAEAPLASFRAVTLAWGERRSATMPLQTGSYTQPKWSHRLAWAVGAAALAIGITLPVMHRGNALQPETSQIASVTELPAVSSTQRSARPSVSAPAVVRVQVAEEPAVRTVAANHEREMARDNQIEIARDNQIEIARDNQMMKTIDRELDASTESSASLGLAAEDVPAPASARPSSMRD